MDDPYDSPTSRVEHIATHLAFISIARSSFLNHIHAVVSQLLKPNSEFFSITLNDTDVLLILDEDAGREFQSTAIVASDDMDITPVLDPNSGGVKVSQTQWTALSLDVSRSPARLRKISDSMQSSGIPAIYQSAMNCDYLFVPTMDLQKALSVLSEEVGLVLSEDERPNRARQSTSQGWGKSQSRKPKRRTSQTHGYDDRQSSSPSSSDISSSHQRGRPKPPSQAIRKTQLPPNLPPVRLLTHKMVFHGLNCGPHGDWLLKLVKMIGWPHSLVLPKVPKVSPGYFGYGNRQAFSQQGPPRSNNERPRRPGFVTRHSDDAHTFKKGPSSRSSGIELNAHASNVNGSSGFEIKGLVGTPSRSRSTSYPDSLPDFYCSTAKRQLLSSQSNGIPSSPGGSGFAPGLPPPAEHPPPAPHSRKTAATDDHSPAPIQNQLHTQILPFFSLTCRMRSQYDIEVSIMTRGSLLAQLFESSMLIGGSGDIAISDSEEEELCEDGYVHRNVDGLHHTQNGSPQTHRKNSSFDRESRFNISPSSSPGMHSSGSRQSAQSGLDEGFKCLQIDLRDVDSKDHAKLLPFLAETLDSHGVKHHFARTLGAINVMVPYSQAKRACDLLLVPGQ